PSDERIAANIDAILEETPSDRILQLICNIQKSIAKHGTKHDNKKAMILSSLDGCIETCRLLECPVSYVDALVDIRGKIYISDIDPQMITARNYIYNHDVELANRANNP